MNQHTMYERVLSSLHDAMLDETYWPVTAGLIDDVCRVNGNVLVVGEGEIQPDIDIYFSSFSHFGQHDGKRERQYFERYFPDDERVPRIRQLPDCKLYSMSDLYTQEEIKTSPTYNKWLPRIGYQNGLNVRMDGPHGAHIVWVFGDSTDPGGWGADQIQTIQRLLPHVRQFVQIRQAVASAEAVDASLTGLLDNTRVGVIYLNRRGRIVTANDRAQDHLRQSDGLFDREGYLSAWLPADHARLEHLLAQALPKSGEEAVGASLTLRRSAGKPQLVLHVSPVSPGQANFAAWRIAAVVLIVEQGGQAAIHPASQAPIDPASVATALNLTPTEGKVAALLAAGNTIRDIAMVTDRRETSVRWHLRHIFKKKAISRQADLVRLVLTAADLPRAGIHRSPRV